MEFFLGEEFMLLGFDDDELKNAYNVAARIDSRIKENGLPGLIDPGRNRFIFTVVMNFYDGSISCVKECYAIVYDQWLFVFKDLEINAHSLETIDSYEMSVAIDMPCAFYYEDEDKLIINSD
jgi:hypothetical protein